MINGQLATATSHGLGLPTRAGVRLAAGLLMAASPLALTQAMATTPATGAYTITPKLVGSGPATVTATIVSPATTSTTTSAKTVTVTTTTTSGTTAFNAFTDFTVGKTVAVNLVIPNGAKNLVNTVDNQVNINGTIYSTLTVNNGSVLGGHVFFVAPNGFVLGPDGSINVGALTVETATASLANPVTGALDVGDFPTAGVLNGSVTLDGTGAIDIQGKINASGINDSTSGDSSVSLLSANTVTVEAGAQVNAGGAAPITAFTALVAGGAAFTSATGVVNADGGDVILTGGTMDVAGAVSANALGTGNAGTVTAAATGFTLDSGGSITASAPGTGTAGAIGITVADSQTVQLGDATATGDVTIDGTMTGASVTVTDTANAKASLSIIPTHLIAEGATLGTLAGLMAGLTGAYVDGKGTTDVEFQSAANVNATGAITVSATSTSEGSAPLLNLLGASPTTVSVSYAEIQSNATVHVASGAQLTAGGALSLVANNVGTLSAVALSYQDNTQGASVSSMADAISVGVAGVHSTTNVDYGAHLSAQSITAAANNQDNFSVSATSYATGGATAGIAVVYKDTTTSATTNFNASTGAAATTNPVAAKTGPSLSIQALDDTIKDATSASTGTGPTIAGTILDATVGQVQNGAKKFWGSLLGTSSGAAASSDLENADSGGDDGSGHYRLAATVAINDSTGSADATLGSGAATPTSNYTTGDVVVAALENDLSVRNNAQAEVASKSEDQTTTAISAAVAYGDFNHSSSAEIAPDTTVDANRIAVNAQTLQPISNDFLQFISDPSVSTVLSHLNPNLGVVNDILTSYANATSASTNLSLAGALSLFDSTVNTYAWVGNGAHLTTAVGATPVWTAILQDGSTIGGTGATATPGGVAYVSAPSWSDGLVVDAYTEQSSIDVGGSFGIVDTLKIVKGKDANDSTSVGGAYNGVTTDATTIAGIDAGANITAPTGLGVNALTDNQIVALAPSAGAGTGIGGSGMVSNLLITDHTHAIVSNDATVSTDTLSMEGQQTFELINIAADYVSAGSAAVGVGAAVSTMNTDTTAQIGDATGDAATVYDVSSVAAPTTTGVFHVDSLTIHADTDGYAAQAGIAGAKAVGPPPPTPSPDSASGASGQASADAAQSGAFTKLWTSIKSALSSNPTEGPTGMPPSFSLAGAGSVALSFANADSTAQIQGLSASHKAAISAYTPGGAITTNVVARDNPTLVAGAGAGAKISSDNASPNTVAIAGSVTVQEPNDHAVADITNATITTAGSTNVEGLVGGVAVSAALAASVNSGSATTGSKAFAGAVSVFIDTDEVDATIGNSVLTGLTGGSGRNTTVTAYDDSDIGVGGGAGFSAGQAGAGFAATYISVGDPSGAKAVEADVTNSTLSQMDATSVQAGDASVLVGLAAVGASGGGTANEFTGSVVDIELSRDVLAQTDTSTSISSGAITVTANGLRQSALDNVLINNGSDTAGTTGYDFTGQTSTTGAVEDGSGDSLAVGSGQGALIVAASGQVALGGKNVIGASFTGVDLTGSHKAIVDDSTLNAGTGGVTVHASDDSLVVGLGVGIASGTSFTVTGSLTLMQESSTILADVRDSSQLTGGLITLQATDAATLASLAGDFAKSTSGAAGDAAIAIMTAEGSASATSENSTLSASNTLAVSAADTGLLVNIAVAGAASSTSLAVEGAIVVNVVDQGALASLTSVTDTAGGAVNVGAGSSQTIWAGALAAGYSGGQVAAGVGVVTSVLGDDSDGERAKALIDGGTFTVSDLTVGSSADATINVAGVGIQFGNSSASGSIVTNVNRGDVTATIDDGAHVTAQDNVGVTASSADTARVIAGAVAIGKQAAGIGVSVVTNVLDGGTNAAISGSTTQVTAFARNGSDLLTVDTGALASPVNLGAISDLVSPVSTGLTLATKTVAGVAVNAASTEQIDVASLSLGLAKQVGIAANIVTNVSGGATGATIDQAAINQAAGAVGASQTIDVSASDNAYTADLVGSIAGGQTVGFAAAINTAGFDRTTDAHVTNATIGAKQTANIDSTSSQTVVGFTVGGAAGQVGAAASVTVATFGATTRAYASGGTATAGTLNVNASDTAGDNINTASIAFGSSVGVAGGFDVTQNDDTTFAGLGRSSVPTVSDSTISGETVYAGQTNVVADTETTWHLHTVGGSAGGSAGIAAMGGILLSADDTEAGVYGGTVQAPNIGGSRVSANGLTVKATDNIYADMISGTLSLSGGVGIGASIGVILDSDSVGSTIDAANVKAGAIDVNTYSTRNLGEILVTGAGGADAGIGATVGVILIGGGEAGGYGEQAFDELLPSLSAIGSGTSGLAGASSNTTLTGGEQSLANNGSAVTTPTSLSNVVFSSVLSEVKNSILAGSNVQVTDTVSTITTQQDGALGVGLYFGAGGSVGYTAFSDRITASIDVDSRVTAGTINVSALTQDDGGPSGNVNSYVGSAGLVGIGAAVAIVDDNMVVNAQAGGALTGTSGAGDSLTVAAIDTTSDKTTTYDGSLGGGAAGAVVSEITKDGSVEGQILATPSGTATTITDFASVTVSGLSSGGLDANGLAASGGAGFALSGAYVSAEDGDSVDAQLGVANFGATPSGVTVSATRTPSASADATGISLGGGLAVGASISQATVDGHDFAQVASGSSFADGASLTVKAFMTDSGGDSASATSIAGAGSLFVGADASTANASNSSSVEAFVNSNVAFGSGNLTIQADRDVNQDASATGIAVGGLLAVGATVAQTSSSGDVSAWLDKGFKSVDNAPAVLMGALKIEAGTGIGTLDPAASSSGTDDIASATAISGSGAPIAGTAGVATTSQTATVYAGIKDFDAPASNAGLSTIYAMGGVAIDTNYITQSTVSSDTLQAAFLGGSGAVTTRTVDPTLNTTVGANLALETPESLTVTALLQSTLGGTTTTGAGGLINGNAAVDTANVDPTITLNVGNNDKLLVVGDPSNDPGALKLIAGALVTGTDSGTMTTGGGIEGPYVKTAIEANFHNTVNVGSGVSLLSVGAIDIGDYVISTITSSVEVSTYGGVGAAGGESIAQVTANDTINVGANTNIAAYGNITIAAGQSADGFESTVLNTNAGSDVYNWTALPVNTDEYARAEADNTSNLNIASGVDIEGVANVNLIAYDPSETVTASGKGHNPYLSIFGVTSDDSHPVTSSNSTITFAGKANAGVLASQGVNISQNGTITVTGSLATVPLGLAALGQASLNGAAATSGMLDTYDSLQSQINAELMIIAGTTDTTTIDKANAAIAALTALQANAPYTTVSVGGTSSTPPSAAVIAAYQMEYTHVVTLLTATANSTTATAAQISTANADLTTLSGLPLAIAQQQAIIYDPASTSAQVSAAMAEIAALDSALPSNGSTSAPVKVGVPVPSVTIAPLYAAAGNLTIQAKTFTDTNQAANTLTAQGGVTIAVSDARTGVPSGADLITDVITVPVENATGGNVYFLGGAAAPGNASVVHQIGVNGTPSVTIQNTSSNSNGAPLILADGEIDNYGGSVTISNLEGDIGQYAEINSLSLSILAPSGVYAVPNLDGTAKAGATPEALWAGDQIVNSNTGGADLAYYEANAEFNNGAFGSGPVGAVLFNQYLTSDYYGSNHQSGTGGYGASNQLGYSTSCTGSNCVNVLVLYTNVPNPGTGYQNFDGSNFAFDQVPIYTTSSTKTAAQAPTDYSPAISASAVFINATNINVNNTIHAGASNWSVNIIDTNALVTELSTLDSQFSKGLIGGGNVDVTSLVSKVGSSDQQISVMYDVADKQFVLGGVKGGAAGLIELTGGIADTSPAGGLIQVNNGLATINVENNTLTPLQVQTLNAGSSSPAMVVITDTNKELNNSPVTTWFVQPVGGAAKEYDDRNEILANTPVSLTGAEDITPSNGVLTYSPESNLRFYWTDTYTASRTINAPGSYVYNWSANAWNANGGGETSSYFQVDHTGDTNFFDTKLSGSITNVFWNSFGISCGCRGFPNNPFTVNALDVTGVSVTETSSLKADNKIGVSFGGNTSGTINIASEGSVLIAGNISNPNGATSITVLDANANLAGSIQEAGGSIVAQTLTLAAGAIGYSPSSTGAGAPTPLNLTLTSGSLLTARSNNGIDLAITGAANIATISAGNGDVILSATQGIYAGAGATPIVGDNITLAGGSGGVGAVGAPIKIGATQISTDPSVTSHGVVNASGILDIDIEKTSGDLLLGQVASTNGNVTLVADTGSIANAITAFTVDSANVTALTAEWQALNLQNSANAIAQTITPFENTVNADYREYWGIVQNATIAGGKATLSPSETVLFSGSAFAAGGTLTNADHNLLTQIVANSTITVAPGGTPQVALTPTQEAVFSGEVRTALGLSVAPTSAQIDLYVSNHYTTYYTATTNYVFGEYHRITTYVNDTTTFDAGPPAGFLSAYDANYAYTLTAGSDAALYAKLTAGAGAWTNTQLADSINANALVPVSNTNIIQQAPNASGKTITLTANTGQIGNNLALNITSADGTVSPDGGTLTVSLAAPLTNTDSALLAAAAPGDLVVNGPANSPTSITIALPHLVGIAATEAITATANGNIFLGSNGAGALSDIASTNGQVRLDFGGSITNSAATCLSTAASCVPAVKAGFLIIEAANGDIGTAAKPLTTSLFYTASGQPAPLLDSARAAGNLYISEVLDSQALTHTEAANLNVGVVFAGSALDLNAQDGAILSGLAYAPNVVRIQGGSIGLTAKNGIGASGAPLQVQTTGLLTASGSSLYLYSPTAPLALGAANIHGYSSLTGAGFTFDGAFQDFGGLGVVSTGPVIVAAAGSNPTTPAGSIVGDHGSVYVTASTITVGAGGEIELTNPATAGVVALRSMSGALTFGANTVVEGGSLALTSATALTTGPSDSFVALSAPIPASTVDAAFNAATSVTFGDNDTVQAATSIGVTAQNDILGSNDSFTAGSTLTLTGSKGVSGGTGDLLNAATGITAVAGTTAFGANLKATTTGGLLAFTSTVGALSLGQSDILTAPTVSLTAKGLLSEGSGDIFTAKATDVSLSGAVVMFGTQDSLTAARNVAVTSLGVLTGGDAIALTSYNGSIGVSATDINLGQGVTAKAPLAIAFTATSGALYFGGTDTLSGQSVALSSRATMSLGALAQLTTTGGALKLSGAAITLGANDILRSAGELDIVGAGVISGGGTETLSSTNGQLNVTGQSVSFTGPLYATSYGPMNLTATSGALQVGAGSNINAYNTLAFGGSGGLTVGASTTVSVGSNFSWTTYQSAIFGAADHITVHGNVVGKSTTLAFGSGGSLTANGAINLTTSGGGMVLGALSSLITSGPAITLTSATTILGNGDGQTNLTTNGSAAVVMTAGGDIGSSGLALSMKTTALTATGHGNMWLRTLTNLLTRKTTAPGTITINGQKVASN